LRHARLELWSRGDSFAHRRHPVAKIAVALVFLICIATLKPSDWSVGALYFTLLCLLTLAARLPLRRVLLAAAVVLPFATIFALFSLLAGAPERGLAIMGRAWLSALTTILLMGTTSQPDLLAGLESARAPRFLIQVMQFLYRYLLVLIQEAGAMRDAAASRAGKSPMLEFRRAAGAAGVLFARSWTRANAIHQAMTARGFTGHIPTFHTSTFTARDLYLFAAIAVPVIGLRLLAR
jgi:cobalt/nickel transport system permease protein